MTNAELAAALQAIAKQIADLAAGLATPSQPSGGTTAPATVPLVVTAYAEAGPATAGVAVDGKSAGSISVTATKAAPASVTLQVPAGAKVTLTFNNDTWTDAGDRNLYVTKVMLDGKTLPPVTAPGNGNITAGVVAFFGNGPVDFSATGTPITNTSAPTPAQPSSGTGSGSTSGGSGTGTTSPAQPSKRPWQSKPQIAWIQGNGPPDIPTMEKAALATWCPRVPDYSLPYLGNGSKSDFNSVGWLTDTYRGSLPKGRIMSCPILYNGIGLGDAVNDKDLRASYKTIAQWIVANWPKDAEGERKIRNSWEFNGDWFPWHIKGDAGNWGALLAQLHVIMVDIYKSVDPSFKFILNWNIGQDNPRFAFPDSSFNSAYKGPSRMDTVDYLAIDVYTQPQWDGQSINLTSDKGVNGAQYFDFQRTRQFGLDDLVALGDQTGKDIMVGEWGVTQETFGRASGADYVKAAWAYFVAKKFKTICYWDSPAGDNGQLWNGAKPSVAAAMKAAMAGL